MSRIEEEAPKRRTAGKQQHNASLASPLSRSHPLMVIKHNCQSSEREVLRVIEIENREVSVPNGEHASLPMNSSR